MAERQRSKDGAQEATDMIDDNIETPDQQGRSGGNLARDVGTRAALDKATEQARQGVTRVRKSDEIDPGEDK